MVLSAAWSLKTRTNHLWLQQKWYFNTCRHGHRAGKGRFVPWNIRDISAVPVVQSWWSKAQQLQLCQGTRAEGITWNCFASSHDTQTLLILPQGMTLLTEMGLCCQISPSTNLLSLFCAFLPFYPHSHHKAIKGI